jgi:hypothetical protein
MTTAMATASEPMRSETPRPSHARLHHHANGGHKRKQESTLASWLGELQPEITKLKSLALGTLLGTAREMILKAVPEHMGAQLKEIVDNVTAKVGGEPIPSSDWEHAPLQARPEEPEQAAGIKGSARRRTVGQYDDR